MKHPGTSGTMPVKGSGCGIRPDLDEFGEDTGFDFSQAQQFLAEQLAKQQAPEKTHKNPQAKPEDSEPLTKR